MKNILKNTEKNIDRNKKPLIFVLPNAMKRAGKMDKTMENMKFHIEATPSTVTIKNCKFPEMFSGYIQEKDLQVSMNKFKKAIDELGFNGYPEKSMGVRLEFKESWKNGGIQYRRANGQIISEKTAQAEADNLASLVQKAWDESLSPSQQKRLEDVRRKYC